LANINKATAFQETPGASKKKIVTNITNGDINCGLNANNFNQTGASEFRLKKK
jgi:hypothetical protein